jgi:hypothetical protein
VAVDPLFAVLWNPELLRVRTATVESEEPAAPAPEKDGKANDGKAPEKDAPKAAEAEKEPELGTVRGLELPRGLEKPVLVYFHWPHEDGERGRRVVKFCKGPLDDEVFVRVTRLFHCVEVNTRDSEARLVEEAGVRSTPSLVVCRPDGKVVWRSEEPGSNGRALAETMKKVLRERFPAAWEGVQKTAEAQKTALAAARRLVEAKKPEEAMAAAGAIVDSDVRFTEEWAAAVKLYRDLEKKAAEDAKEKAK